MSINVKVGNQVKMGDHSYIVTSIETTKQTRFSEVDSEVLKQQYQNYTNTKHLKTEIEQFEAHEIIDLEQQVVELTDPGKHIFFIYTYTKVRKVQEEILDGEQGVSSTDASPSEDEVKDDRQGGVCEGSEGAEVVSENSDPSHGAGRVQEIRPTPTTGA